MKNNLNNSFALVENERKEIKQLRNKMKDEIFMKISSIGDFGFAGDFFTKAKNNKTFLDDISKEANKIFSEEELENENLEEIIKIISFYKNKILSLSVGAKIKINDKRHEEVISIDKEIKKLEIKKLILDTKINRKNGYERINFSKIIEALDDMRTIDDTLDNINTNEDILGDTDALIVNNETTDDGESLLSDIILDLEGVNEENLTEEVNNNGSKFEQKEIDFNGNNKVDNYLVLHDEKPNSMVTLSSKLSLISETLLPIENISFLEKTGDLSTELANKLDYTKNTVKQVSLGLLSQDEFVSTYEYIKKISEYSNKEINESLYDFVAHGLDASSYTKGISSRDVKTLNYFKRSYENDDNYKPKPKTLRAICRYILITNSHILDRNIFDHKGLDSNGDLNNLIAKPVTSDVVVDYKTILTLSFIQQTISRNRSKDVLEKFSPVLKEFIEFHVGFIMKLEEKDMNLEDVFPNHSTEIEEKFDILKSIYSYGELKGQYTQKQATKALNEIGDYKTLFNLFSDDYMDIINSEYIREKGDLKSASREIGLIFNDTGKTKIGVQINNAQGIRMFQLINIIAEVINSDGKSSLNLKTNCYRGQNVNEAIIKYLNDPVSVKENLNSSIRALQRTNKLSNDIKSIDLFIEILDKYI